MKRFYFIDIIPTLFSCDSEAGTLLLLNWTSYEKRMKQIFQTKIINNFALFSSTYEQVDSLFLYLNDWIGFLFLHKSALIEFTKITITDTPSELVISNKSRKISPHFLTHKSFV